MAGKGWIEQDEFEQRRSALQSSLFGQKGHAGTTALPARTKLPPTGGHGSSACEGDLLRITLRSMAGEVVWGPTALARSLTVESLMLRVAEDMRKTRKARSGFQILRGEVQLVRTATLVSALGTAADAELSIVFVDPVPSDAREVGDLAVWEKPKEGQSRDATGGRFEVRSRQVEEELIGRDLRSGDVFWHKSIFGRCNSMFLRLGRQGLYYNSSSHGTASLTVRTYKEASTSPADDLDDFRTEVGVIPGCHVRSKDAAGWVAARGFAHRLCTAAGLAAASEDLGASAWVSLLVDLGVGTSAAGLWSVVFLPWLENLNSMNERELWRWIEAGFPASLAEVPEEVQGYFIRDTEKD